MTSPNPARDPRTDPERFDKFSKRGISRGILETSETRVWYVELCRHKKKPETLRRAYSTMAQFRRWAKNATVEYIAPCGL